MDANGKKVDLRNRPEVEMTSDDNIQEKRGVTRRLKHLFDKPAKRTAGMKAEKRELNDLQTELRRSLKARFSEPEDLKRVNEILKEIENSNESSPDITSQLCYKYRAELFIKYFSDPIRQYMFQLAKSHILIKFGDKRLDKALENPDYQVRMQKVIREIDSFR